MSFSWMRTATALRKLVAKDAAKPREDQYLDDGQRASLTWMAKRLPQSGVVLADEVGMGKTRIACEVVHAVLEAGGRVAVVVPHGLMHQWQREARVLGMSSAKEFTSMRDFVENAKKKPWSEIAPVPNQPEWLLVSHGFRAPQVRQGKWPSEWRVALPSYVRAELSANVVRNDRRTIVGKLLEDPHETTQKIAKDLASQVHGQDRACLRSRLDQLPPYRRGGDNTALVDALQSEGRCVVEKLLGLWLGKFDLLVIDEAHKSRSDVDVEDAASGAASRTVLARLVDDLLSSEGGRRLCLTATPMELELLQWGELLKRSRSGLDNEHGETVIYEFQAATRNAAIAPDEGNRLDELIKKSKAFETLLRDYVTRRRRDDDPLIASFRTGAALPEGLPHPHRRLQRVQTEWTETVGQHSPWLEVLFAAECMGQAAIGLKTDIFESALVLASGNLDEKKQKRLKHLIRDLYARIASGHLSGDVFDADVRIVPPDDCEEGARRKLQRTEYWRTKIQRAVNTSLHEDEHPRILVAAKEIEGWTLKREKVLVFGVFLRPLRLLRDVLNVRYALRAADAGLPIAHVVHTDAVLLEIALRQLKRLRAEHALSGRLASGNGAKIRRALADSHKAYERLRKKVRRRAKKSVVSWRTDPSLLGGSPVDRKLDRALENHLVSFVIDDFLATASESGKITDECFEVVTTKFVEEHLRPLLGEPGNEDVDKGQAVLRQEALRALIDDDDGRQSFHARLLQGATRWETRRYLQAAFNRPRASPWVLIAQSHVGREGLNLHESCRVVVQFHAEWNPAVLEQQIGRVDRKGGLWEQLAKDWLKERAQGEPPFIEVRQLIFEGTYDAFQWDRVMRRQHVFDASLFGSLLPAEVWQRVPKDRQVELLDAAPSFRPGRIASPLCYRVAPAVSNGTSDRADPVDAK